MQRKTLEPLVNDIVKNGLIIVGLSVGISIISFLLTEDLTQSNGLFFEAFILALSDFTFFFGMISVLLGLVIGFF